VDAALISVATLAATVLPYRPPAMHRLHVAPTAARSYDDGMDTGPVVLFDGVCNLCDASVQFVIKRDPQGRFRFASFQGDRGARMAREHGVDPEALDSMVLIEGSRVYRKSSAALRVARRLRFPWPLLYAFIVVPPFIRNPVYDFIGRRRYRWFGRKEACWVPDAALRARFLDQ
jgi:predicted DCC family thiol-disulfide oxidoreductase YuxK